MPAQFAAQSPTGGELPMTGNAMSGKRQPALEPVDEAADHVRGPAAGPLILENGDYECPYSRQAFRAIERVETERRAGVQPGRAGLWAVCRVRAGRGGRTGDKALVLAAQRWLSERPRITPTQWGWGRKPASEPCSATARPPRARTASG